MLTMKTNDAQYDDALKQLARALRKTAGTEGRPIARRNARQAALRGLRHVRALLDEKAPAIVVRSEPRVRKTGEKRVEALEKAGWVRQGSIAAARFAAAGVPVKHVKWKTTAIVAGERKYIPRKGWVQDQHTRVDRHETILVPRWALAIGPDNPTKLRAAKKDPLLRKSVVADQMLRESNPS